MSTFAKELFIKAGERMKDDVEVAAYIARSEERRKLEDIIAKLEAENSKYMAESAAKDAEIASLKAALTMRS